MGNAYKHDPLANIPGGGGYIPHPLVNPGVVHAPSPELQPELQPEETPTIKASNPKDSQASNRLPMCLVPASFIAHVAHAFAEGDFKYGGYNWREAGVSARVYGSALLRHYFDWFNGENLDPKSRVHHLANAAACIAVLLDAELCGMLNDDRPPRAPVGELIRSMEAGVAHLRELYKDAKPHKYTVDGIIPHPGSSVDK